MTKKLPPPVMNDLDERVLEYFITAARGGFTTPRAHDIARSLKQDDLRVQMSISKLVKMNRLLFDRTRNCEIVGTGLYTENKRRTPSNPEVARIEIPQNDRRFDEAMAGRTFDDVRVNDGGFRFRDVPATYVPTPDN